MGRCCKKERGSGANNAISLLLRLSTMGLALTSAVTMAMARDCSIYQPNRVILTVTFKDYSPFRYTVISNIAAACLQALVIYLHIRMDRDEEDEEAKLPKVVLVLLDIAVQALLYSSTGATFAAVSAYGRRITDCTGSFCDQVNRSKIFSLGASISVGSAVAVKAVPLPFSLWPNSS